MIATGIVIVTGVTVAIGIAIAAVVTTTRTKQPPEAATTDVTDSVTSASLANRWMQLAPMALSVQAANSSIASARRARKARKARKARSNRYRSRKELRSRHKLPRADVRNVAIGVIAGTAASAGVVVADAVVAAAGDAAAKAPAAKAVPQTASRAPKARGTTRANLSHGLKRARKHNTASI